MKAWWFVRRPNHHGACAAVWHGSRILLVRCSYRPWTVLPGGFPARSESLVEAAARELAEEAGIRLAPADFRPAGVYEHRTEYLQDHIHLFEAQLPFAPVIAVDQREIVWADFVEVEEALTMNLLPPVRAYLARRRTDTAAAATSAASCGRAEPARTGC